MSLPLVIRKKIRDSEPALKENLEKLQVATGKEFEFEADWATVISQVEANCKDNIGETYQKEALSYLVTNIERLAKDEMAKEAFVEATSANKIIFRVNDKAKNYWQILFENGALVCEHKKSICNLYELANINLVAIIPTPGLPLATRLNIEANKEKLDENLEKLNAATGESDWSVEIDFEKVLPDLEASNRGRVGDMYYSECLSYLVGNIERALKKETTKESFNEATTQHKVVFAVNDKQKAYWEVKFENGALLATHKKAFCNLYELGNVRLEELIPSPGGLPLVTRLNIEEYRPSLEEHLEKINELTGASDWTFEADYEKAIKADPNATHRIGETYQKEVLSYLVTNLERVLKNETAKEAFNEATSSHKVSVRIDTNPKATKYWDMKFENGELVLIHKPSICNIYEIANYNINSIIPVPGILSLLARLNIQNSQEKLQEHLEKLKEATGEEYSLDDSCYEGLYKAQDQDHARNNIGDTFLNEAVGYLVGNLERRLKDEMVKEAFNEVATAHQITFRHDPKQKDYWTIKFENGYVVCTFKQSCNLYELGNFDIEKLL